MRQNMVNTDLSAILPEELETKIKEEAEVSMGTDISDSDLFQIQALCDQVGCFTLFNQLLQSIYDFLLIFLFFI